MAGAQMVAVANTIKFLYDDGTTRLAWESGLKIDSAVWVSAFLVVAVALNLMPVRVSCLPHSYSSLTGLHTPT